MSKTILLIEDDLDVLRNITFLLKSNSHTVHGFQDGQSSETFISQDKPEIDVVVCDYDLGMFDRRKGPEICEALRKLLPTSKFIIYSGLQRDGLKSWMSFLLKSNPKLLLGAIDD